MTVPLTTSWKISAIERRDTGPTLRGLDITLTLDTSAEEVVHTLEHGLRKVGFRIERVDEPDPGYDPSESADQ